MPGTSARTTSSGDQSDIMGNNGTSQRMRAKGVAKLEQIRAFEIAVMDYKKDFSEKSWSNIEKVLQVRLKDIEGAVRVKK